MPGEERLEGVENSESYGIVGISGSGWLGLKLRGRSDSFGSCWHDENQSSRGKASQGEYAE